MPIDRTELLRAQYKRLRRVMVRELRFMWRFTAAAFFRFRSWVGFS
jgi:hypothetical protein